MTLLREINGKRVLIALTAALAVACSTDKKTLVEVQVSLGDRVATPSDVSVTVTPANSAPLGPWTFRWSQAQNGTLFAGVFLPDSAAGKVTIAATGAVPDATVTGTASVDATIQAGQTNGPYKLTLQIPSSGGDAGVPDTGADAAADLNNPDAAPIAPDGGGADLLAVDGRGAESAVPDGSPDGVSAVDGWGPESGLPSHDGGDVPVDGNLLDAPLPSLDGPGVDAPINSDTAPATPDAAPDVSPPLTWQPATNVENDVVARSFDPAIAVEPLTENVFVAWYESGKVKVLRYDRKGRTWSAAKTLEDRGLPYGVGIGTDANGHIIVAWYQDARASDPALPGVWVSHSSDGKSWSPPQQVVPGTVVTDWGGRNSLHLAVARIGIARMVYSLKTGVSPDQVGLYTAYFDGTSWMANPDPVVDPNSPNSTSPYSADAQLAIGGTGDGVVVFDAYNASDAGKANNVGVVNLIGSTRTPPQIVSNNTAGGTGDRFVSMNADGAAVVVWWDDAGLLASTYKPAGTWSTPQKIKDGGEFILVTTVLDNDGFLTAAWDQAIANGSYNVMAIRGKVGGTWSDIVPIETDNVSTDSTAELAHPQLAVDAQGSVLVVWSKKINDTTRGAYARRLQGTEWQPQVELGKKSGLQAQDPVVAVADSGFGASAFEYYDSSGTTTDLDVYNVEVAFCR
jgi:hypothetical protein